MQSNDVKDCKNKLDNEGQRLNLTLLQQSKIRTWAQILDKTCGDYRGVKFVRIEDKESVYTWKKAEGCPSFCGLSLYKNGNLVLDISNCYNLR